MKEHKVQKNFQRIESKYLVDAKTMTAMEKEFSQHLVPDDYPVSTISNLYFDNADYDLVEDSLARLHGREKVRMRTYDAKPKSDSFAFLEIKKKILEVGYKYRFVADMADIIRYVAHPNKAHPDANLELQLTLLELQRRYVALKPMMFIGYNRHSYRGIEDPKVRVTIDREVVYRNYALDLTAGRHGEPLIEENQVILEIKVNGDQPDWMVEILNRHQVEEISFSKYGQAYSKTLKASEVRLAL